MTGRLQRDWTAPNEKARAQVAQGCRVCAGPATCRAHTIGRAHDPRSSKRRVVVQADDIVLLCDRCHHLYDAHGLDLFPHLSDNELRSAILRAGGPGHACRRLSGPLWRSSDPEAVVMIDRRLEALGRLTP